MDLQVIQQKIYEIRGLRVMLDFDLAEMYEITTSNLNKAVIRNIDRFPEDFMFELSKEEFETLRTQIAISNEIGSMRYLPYAFTEHGVTMLAGLLNSTKAIETNIQIVRAFIAADKNPGIRPGSFFLLRFDSLNSSRWLSPKGIVREDK